MLKSKIYIASPIKNEIVNRELAKAISEKTDFLVFLPESLNLKDSVETIDLIAFKCYSEIDESTVLIVILPYGLSTAAEIGYTICKKRMGKDIKILMFNPNKIEIKMEAAIQPFITKVFYTQKDIIEYLNKIFKPKNHHE